MKLHNEIPQALINLKNSLSITNWNLIKKLLISYLNLKRELYNSNLSSLLKKRYDNLNYKEFLENSDIIYLNLSTVDINTRMPSEVIVSHYKNVLKTLRKIEYKSKIMCFLQGSENTIKSGNKKYPNL